jgi:hypothetical protein
MVCKPRVRVENDWSGELASSPLHSLAFVPGRSAKRCLIQSIMSATAKTSDDIARREAAVVITAVVAFMSEFDLRTREAQKTASAEHTIHVKHDHRPSTLRLCLEAPFELTRSYGRAASQLDSLRYVMSSGTCLSRACAPTATHTHENPSVATKRASRSHLRGRGCETYIGGVVMITNYCRLVSKLVTVTAGFDRTSQQTSRSRLRNWWDFLYTFSFSDPRSSESTENGVQMRRLKNKNEV